MAQFCKSISHGVVNRTLAHLTSLDVSNRNAQGERHRGGSQHLVAIRNQQKQIRPHLPNRSARLSVAMPMVLAIPTSLSELSKHSIREAIGNPSFTISSIVLPNSGDKCDPRAIIFRSTF